MSFGVCFLAILHYEYLVFLLFWSGHGAACVEVRASVPIAAVSWADCTILLLEL